MDHGRLKTEYLCYLMNRAQIEAAGTHGYLKLCEILQDTDFFPLLEMDENRCEECRDLRNDFAEGYDEENLTDILDDLFPDEGTMMELLVVLAEKMQFNLAESKYEAGTGKWFKELLQNCGLIEDDNEAFKNANTENNVRDILDTIIFHKTGWDGEGGLFPLRWPRGDQRLTEFIVQMNDYIEENYDIC